ncbi:MAG TPA: SulP family inorganic anion transporter [Xanthobacteraceae bacterium]|nr:SulP family inorganic anion transporter [Xanthobacteraceae bacterium]
MAGTESAQGGGAAKSRRVWPLLRSLAGYRAEYLPRDLAAGLTLAAIAIPEQMATAAKLGGFAPQFGLMVLVAGALGFAIFGGSRYLSCGADSTITPIFFGGLSMLAVGHPADYPALAAALALMVGVMLVAAGIFRLGWIADLLSVPVTTGFLAGIAVHILLSQLPSVLGVETPKGDVLLARLATLAGEVGATNLYTLAIGAGVLATIIVSERIDGRIPGALIGLVVATLAVVAFDLEHHGVKPLGDVKGELPHVALPLVAPSYLTGLITLALIITMTVMVQTAATTRSFPPSADEPPDVDRDFIGVGAANVLTGLIGAFAVNASPPRTAIVAESGGRSQVAGLTSAAITVLLLVVGAALLRHVPEAALGGVLLFVALRIFRIRQIVGVLRQTLAEFLLIVATAAAIVVLPIEEGVGIGIALSLLHGIWTTTQARLVLLERVPGTTIWWPRSPRQRGECDPDIVVAGLQAPLSFLNANRFRADARKALQSAAAPVRVFVLEATGIVEIDYTGAQALIAFIRECHERQVPFAIARLESVRAQDALTRFHVHEVLDPDRIFHSVEEAIRALAPRPA